MTARYIPGGPTRAVSHISDFCLWDLPETSSAPATTDARIAALGRRGVEAIQAPEPDTLGPVDMPIVGFARIDAPGDAERVAREHINRGYPLTTLHVGTGWESVDEALRLLEPVVEASDRHDYPMFVETHRATVTQDMRRTLDIVGRLPEVRFNADLSHWYTGHEFTYGSVEDKIARLRPVFERVRYVHGRIGTTGAIQVTLSGPDDPRDFVDHHRQLLRAVSEGFLATCAAGEVLPFAPELLPHSRTVGGVTQRFAYAPLMPSGEEEGDRWEQAEILWDLFAAVAREAGLPVAAQGG